MAVCFNEAPALHRGKWRRMAHSICAPGAASMRPRHYTGESGREGILPEPAVHGFNEAPALHRGKLALKAFRAENGGGLQ